MGAENINDEIVIHACTAPLSTNVSSLKGNTPADRAIVKCTKIDEIVEIVEYGVSDSALWHKEFPRSKGDYNKVVDDPVDRSYRDKPLRDYAIFSFCCYPTR